MENKDLSRDRDFNSWRPEAECLGEDPELFFPVGTTGLALEQAKRAKKVCRRCDVLDFCLEWALETKQKHGIWGGMTTKERRKLLRSRQPPKAS